MYKGLKGKNRRDSKTARPRLTVRSQHSASVELAVSRSRIRAKIYQNIAGDRAEEKLDCRNDLETYMKSSCMRGKAAQRRKDDLEKGRAKTSFIAARGVFLFCSVNNMNEGR